MFMSSRRLPAACSQIPTKWKHMVRKKGSALPINHRYALVRNLCILILGRRIGLTKNRIQKMKDEFRIGPQRPDKGPLPTEVEGTVSQYLLNPRGEVDGLLLDDRTVIK